MTILKPDKDPELTTGGAHVEGAPADQRGEEQHLSAPRGNADGSEARTKAAETPRNQEGRGNLGNKDTTRMYLYLHQSLLRLIQNNLKCS